MPKILVSILIFVILAHSASAEKKPILPRFASIKSSEANTRKGPGINYSLMFLYQYKGVPIEIIAEYEQWRKIRDINGDEGWIHSSILSGKRSVMLKSKNQELLYIHDNTKSHIVAKLEPYLCCNLIKCSKSWCKIKCMEYTGWTQRENLWGVYDHE